MRSSRLRSRRGNGGWRRRCSRWRRSCSPSGSRSDTSSCCREPSSFLLHFNASSFDTLVQARNYYQFILFTLLATGLFFEIPIAVLGLNRAGILSTRQLRKHRRYAIVAIAALALLLPGSDPVTTLFELIPMLALYELSILGTAALEHRDRKRTRLQAHP